MDRQNFGHLIKQRREILKLRQEDLSDFSGVGLKTIHSIEQGKANPTLDIMNKITSALGLEIILKMKEIN